jgi:Flp pilus assembly protein TadB
MTKVGSLRASDADREQIVSQLHKAATEGRIASDELEQRVSAALKARTYAELDATVADLPRQLNQRPRRKPAGRSAGGWALSAVRANPFILLFAIPVVAVTFAMVIAATVVWAVLMVVVMVLGGRPRPPRGPWMYTRQRRPYGPPPRRGGPRSYWA